MAAQPAASEPSAAEPSAAEPAAAEPAAAEPAAAEPAAAEPAAAEPPAAEPPAAEPAAAEATEPSAAEPAAAEAVPHPVPHPPAGTPTSTPGAAPAASGPPSWDWGRVADDGTVFLRTPEGERAIGQWHAGDINEGLAYYQRRYEDLVAEVSLLENRLATRTGDARAVRTNASHLKESLATATVIGDVEALRQRLDAVLAGAQERIDAEKAARTARSEQAAAAKRALAEEAEQLAQSTDWKVTGDRFRTLVDDWKAITGVDRKTDQELWTRVSAARSEFGRRRGAHFAQLDTERKAVQQRKEKLCEEAESLSDSSEWGPTAARYKQLMTEWKAAGRAAKPVDDALWARFRAAQDKFFTRRNAVNAERDQQFKQNQQLKEQILAEAEALDPASPGAQRKLREIQSRYDKAGKVPREAMGSLERRMTAVEQKFRGQAETRFRKGPDPSSSPLVIRLRESVDKLERRLERARADGRDNDAAEAEAALATQREWLAQAERAR